MVKPPDVICAHSITYVERQGTAIKSGGLSNGTSRKIHPREANSSKIAFRREVAFLKVIVADLNRSFGVYFAINHTCRRSRDIRTSEVGCHYLHGRDIN